MQLQPAPARLPNVRGWSRPPGQDHVRADGIPRVGTSTSSAQLAAFSIFIMVSLPRGSSGGNAQRCRLGIAQRCRNRIDATVDRALGIGRQRTVVEGEHHLVVLQRQRLLVLESSDSQNFGVSIPWLPSVNAEIMPPQASSLDI